MNLLNPNKPVNQTALAWIIILVVTLIWGSSFLMLKKALIVLGPEQVVAGRMAVAGIVFLPFAIRQAREISAATWGRLLLFAIIANIGTSFSYALAQSQIDSSLNGIINTLSPLMTLLIGILFFRQKGERNQVIGIIIGFLGAASLLFLQKDGQFGAVNVFVLFAVLATFGNGWMTNLLKFMLSDLSPLKVAALTFLITLIPAILYWHFSGATEEVLAHPQGMQSVVFIVLLAVLANGVALILIARLVQITTPVFASLTTYLIPIVAVAWGLWDGESVQIAEIAAMVVISLSVWLVNRDSR